MDIDHLRQRLRLAREAGDLDLDQYLSELEALRPSAPAPAAEVAAAPEPEYNDGHAMDVTDAQAFESPPRRRQHYNSPHSPTTPRIHPIFAPDTVSRPWRYKSPPLSAPFSRSALVPTLCVRDASSEPCGPPAMFNPPPSPERAGYSAAGELQDGARRTSSGLLRAVGHAVQHVNGPLGGHYPAASKVGRDAARRVASNGRVLVPSDRATAKTLAMDRHRAIAARRVAKRRVAEHEEQGTAVPQDVLEEAERYIPPAGFLVPAVPAVQTPDGDWVPALPMEAAGWSPPPPLRPRVSPCDMRRMATDASIAFVRQRPPGTAQSGKTRSRVDSAWKSPTRSMPWAVRV